MDSVELSKLLMTETTEPVITETRSRVAMSLDNGCGRLQRAYRGARRDV